MSQKSIALEKTEDVQQSSAADFVDGSFALARLGQEATLQAARNLVDLVDSVVPVQGGDDSFRRGMVDGAFRLADELASSQLRAVRSVVHRPQLFMLDLDFNAFTFEGVDVNVAVQVPTDVGAFNSKRS